MVVKQQGLNAYTLEVTDSNTGSIRDDGGDSSTDDPLWCRRF